MRHFLEAHEDGNAGFSLALLHIYIYIYIDKVMVWFGLVCSTQALRMVKKRGEKKSTTKGQKWNTMPVLHEF